LPATEIDKLASVHFVELADSTRINDALTAAFEREKGAEHVRRTHHFHGRFENTYIDAGHLPELHPVTAAATAAARQLLGTSALKFGFWFNEMAPGDRTSLHSHEELDEQLSAVYYVRCEEHSGHLVLHDHQAQIRIAPKPGLLVLFPPDLPHEVDQNTSAATRLSVAFNFGPRDEAS
jgi:uncharacterized RmlC-like cupin family protein